MNRPPALSSRPPAVLAFGWVWAVAILAEAGLKLFRFAATGQFSGLDGVQWFLIAIFAWGGWMVVKYAVLPIESGMALGVVFAAANQSLKLFNAIQDGVVGAGVVAPLVFVVLQGLALLLLRNRAAREWLEASWPIIQAHYARKPEGS